MLTKIKELTDREEEHLMVEFNKSGEIGKNENPRRFAERQKQKKNRKGKARRGSNSGENSSGEEIEDDGLEEQALVARHQMQPLQRPLDPSWKPEYH